jgi:transcriptional regulator with XRE-family HTH domain
VKTHPGRVPLPHLRDWRLQAFLSQAELAKLAGLTQGTISELETSKNAANFKTVKKLCLALRITAQQLVYDAPTTSKRQADILRAKAVTQGKGGSLLPDS